MVASGFHMPLLLSARGYTHHRWWTGKQGGFEATSSSLPSFASSGSYHDLQLKEITQAVIYLNMFLSLLQIMVMVKIKGGSGWYLSSRVVGGKDGELLLLKVVTEVYYWCEVQFWQLLMVLVWRGGNYKEDEVIMSRPPWVKHPYISERFYLFFSIAWSKKQPKFTSIPCFLPFHFGIFVQIFFLYFDFKKRDNINANSNEKNQQFWKWHLKYERVINKF